MLAPSLTSIIDGIVTHVDRFGVASSDDQLASLARLAERHAVAPAAAEILVDEGAPAVLRERAVAHAATMLRAVAPTAAPVAA